MQPAKIQVIPARKWTVLLLLSGAEMLAMAVWFSASAVVPELSARWHLGPLGRAALTNSLQIGFVAGALLSALLNLADRIPARVLLAGSICLAAGCTALIPAVSNHPGIPLLLRFLTGMALAGVYPVGMKIVAGWTREDRGLGIGVMIGAMAIGKAAPQLLHVLAGQGHWREVLWGGAACALVGALLAVVGVETGPYHAPAPPFRWRYALELARRREVVLANLGYLGHMWELYAVWAWLPLYVAASFARSAVSPVTAGWVAFAAIAAGCPSSILAGVWADRVGRTRVAALSLGISGACCLLAAPLFGASPGLVAALAITWGFAVVADSAQFSACVSELAEPAYLGTALTLQTCLGFLLTLFTIALTSVLAAHVGWRWAFLPLALGPAFGIAAMLALRRHPASARLAGGRG